LFLLIINIGGKKHYFGGDGQDGETRTLARPQICDSGVGLAAMSGLTALVLNRRLGGFRLQGGVRQDCPMRLCSQGKSLAMPGH